MHHNYGDANNSCHHQQYDDDCFFFRRQSQHYPLKHDVSPHAAGLSLLPPHIHSMLYHSTIGRGGRLLSPQQGCGDGGEATSKNRSPPFVASASLHTLHPTRKVQQPQEKRQPSACGPTALPQAKMCGTAANGVAVAPVALFSGGGLTTAYSPYSANTSLGNGSGSPSTTRGLRTTETKRRLHASPAVCLPTISPFKSGSITTGGITGGALEELLAAEKSELVQILLELSSCSSEVASFVESKAQLFLLRKTTPSGEERNKRFCESGATGVPGDASAKTTGGTASVLPHSLRGDAALGIAERCCYSTDATPSKPLAFEDDSFVSNSCNKTVSALDISSRQTSACNSHQTSALLFTPLNKFAMERRQNSAHVFFSDVEAHVSSEERQWCSETHPCLRLYGSCRHNNNCFFASSPRNLCLNWVRNSCVAGTHCNGVHRLPDTCSQNVLLLFKLSHSADREAVVSERWLQQNRGRTVRDVTECALRTCERPVTPVEQILVNPVSIPASLEHYHHVLRLGDDDSDSDHGAYTHSVRDKDSGSSNNNNNNNNNNDDNSVCNCRSCCVWGDKVEWGSEKQNQELREYTNNSPFLLSHSVPRCLNDSFAAAADNEKDDKLDGDGEKSWTNTMSTFASQHVAACLLESDDDGVTFPPCNVLTRTQSPVVP